jgi:hypothetical protein
MKTTISLAATIIVITFTSFCQTQAQVLFSRTLAPGTTLSGSQPASATNTLVLTFGRTPLPVGDGTFTLTASGDLNGPPDDKEFVLVFGEDGRFLGKLFDGFNGPGEVTETGSVTIPLSLLTSYAADGIVQITVSAASGVAGVTIDSATLAYPSSELVPCAGPRPGQQWKNHGEYVSAVVKVVEELLAQDSLTEEEAGVIVIVAARSECGKK